MFGQLDAFLQNCFQERFFSQERTVSLFLRLASNIEKKGREYPIRLSSSFLILLSDLNQLDLILDIIGTPREEDIRGSDKAKRYMKNLPRRPGKSFKTMFPEASDEAVDLLQKMLAFNPDKRITVEEALEHPYLESMHDPEDEPTSPIFDFAFEEEAETRVIKEMIYETIVEASKSLPPFALLYQFIFKLTLFLLLLLLYTYIYKVAQGARQ